MNGIDLKNKDSQKIPCSVGILTLNSEKTLRRCLESVKNFAEIIVCDGNSTDTTLAIAREYGAEVVKQYDSDEPNLSCVTDKATVRNKNMQAASYDWYVYLDSDDALSTEVVEEIRKIAKNPKPPHLVYQMPMRIFIDGKEVRYSSSYPSYQTRFFNKKSGAYFIRPVHERITFDQGRHTVGMLKHPYNIHLSRRQTDNFWHGHLRRYVDFELSEWKPIPFFSYLRWIFRHPFKGIVRVTLYSLRNYLLHGFSNSMPVKVEFSRIRYHLYIFWRTLKKQFQS